mmetsp:Transcript_31448/g.35932  ORF Transcript_31448/g.35932 Transcript_31448/m.35932 type:complete len:91 (-) Transcript_31448:49-321(-)
MEDIQMYQKVNFDFDSQKHKEFIASLSNPKNELILFELPKRTSESESSTPWHKVLSGLELTEEQLQAKQIKVGEDHWMRIFKEAPHVNSV